MLSKSIMAYKNDFRILISSDAKDFEDGALVKIS
jgi:hypothetical protein